VEQEWVQLLLRKTAVLLPYFLQFLLLGVEQEGQGIHPLVLLVDQVEVGQTPQVQLLLVQEIHRQQRHLRETQVVSRMVVKVVVAVEQEVLG
jgi:hypothetical protein